MNNYSDLEKSIISNSVPGYSVEEKSAGQIPENWNETSSSSAPHQGVDAILRQKINVPMYAPSITMAERVLSTQMRVPNYVEEKPSSYIPEDWLDEMPKPEVKEPSVADVILKTKMHLPVYVKPETAADRILRTPIDTSHLQANRSFSDTFKAIKEKAHEKTDDISLG